MSPNALDTDKSLILQSSPSKYGLPPNLINLLFSSGQSGLWSFVKAIAKLSLHKIHLESPVFKIFKYN